MCQQAKYPSEQWDSTFQEINVEPCETLISELSAFTGAGLESLPSTSESHWMKHLPVWGGCGFLLV